MSQRKVGESMRCPGFGNELVGRRGQWKLADLVLDQNLPYGHDTEEDLVRFVAHCVVRGLRKSRVVADVPEKGVRIEEELHRPSKASRISSGSGSSKSFGTTNWPAASPTGRS